MLLELARNIMHSIEERWVELDVGRCGTLLGGGKELKSGGWTRRGGLLGLRVTS